ncbi:hypothetical protein ATCC90586_008868 [Pythium insidiosum]|nr:hypothetical protein ATCC90586_008868 [Pythium insidiosum]
MGEQTTASLRGAQRRDVYLTGFGKFGDILENPTTFLVQKLADDENVTEAKVLEVSAEGSLEMLAPLRAKAEASGRPCIFLHLGVNAGSTQFALERIGYNVADFRIPDERGWVAKQEVIASGEAESLSTQLPLDDMLEKLKGHTDLVDISTDPGRYICNFVFFHSLKWAKDTMATEGGATQHHALFVHVPQFSVIPLEDQAAFIRQVIQLVSDL